MSLPVLKRSLLCANKDRRQGDQAQSQNDRPRFCQAETGSVREEQEQIDRSQEKLTLAELCDRYLKTVQHQKPRTVERKTFIVQRITTDWPTGKLTQLGKIKPSDVDLWLSRYRFGSASRNLHISCVKELFDLALRDRIITASSAAHLRSVKREKPIRLTPTFEQFKAIIADVRGQVFNADAQDSADFLEFLGLAGLEQAEAGSLTPADVDLVAGQIITYRHKTSTGFAIPIFPQVRPVTRTIVRRESARCTLVQNLGCQKSVSGSLSAFRLSTVQSTLIAPDVHHSRNRARRCREGDCRMAGTQRWWETDSRHLQPRESRSLAAHGRVDD